MIQTTKQCTRCDKIKDLSEFSKSKKSKLGVNSCCKSCMCNKSKEYYLKNKECVLKKRREYHEQNKDKVKKYRTENKDKLAEGRKEWLKKNIVANKEYSKKWRHENKERLAKYRKEYAKTDKGLAMSRNSAHKQRQYSKNGDVTTVQLLKLTKETTHCYWCNCKLIKDSIHIDHYQPRAKDGEHTLSNLVVSCAKCNQTKSAKDPIEFANSIGRLL